MYVLMHVCVSHSMHICIAAHNSYYNITSDVATYLYLKSIYVFLYIVRVEVRSIQRNYYSY